MKRMFALLAMGLFVSAAAAFTAIAQDEKPMTTKLIMKKLHGGKSSASFLVKNQLKSASPKWDVVQKEAKNYVELSEALAKNEPKKGDKASWDKLTEEFGGASKELKEAADEKDKPAAQAAVKKLGASCKDCHDAHKGK